MFIDFNYIHSILILFVKIPAQSTQHVTTVSTNQRYFINSSLKCFSFRFHTPFTDFIC
jgi:hypothetical protein